MRLPEAFTRYRPEIDAALRAALGGRSSPLYDMMRYHLGWVDAAGKPLPEPGGKALRPALCLLTCEALGGDYRRAVPAAAAIELVHNYSLIHDDIQDDDRERRHRPTVWSVWGKPQAINAGTGMRILASRALDGLQAGGASLEKQMRVQRLIDEDCLALIEGQYLDISYETRQDVSVADYIAMIECKTAALIACSFEVGAVLAGDDEGAAAGFRRLGRSLGLAFQIRDDILGIWGDETQTGKPAGSDIRKKKKTLPVIYAVASAPGRLRAPVLDFYRNGASDITPVLRALEEAGAQQRAQALADSYRDEARAALAGLRLAGKHRREMEGIIDFLVEREY